MDTGKKIDILFVAKRSSKETLELEIEKLKDKNSFVSVVNAIENKIFILNNKCEIVFANNSFLNLIGRKHNEIIGEKLGEILECVNSDKIKFGEQIPLACKDCKIANAILKSLEENVQHQIESEIKLKNGNFLDIRLSVSTLYIEQTKFAICSIQDITEVNRRKALHRIFIHDILNSAGAVQQSFEIIDLRNLAEASELILLTKNIVNNLVDEITSQRQIVAAENDEYSPEITIFYSTDILTLIMEKATSNFLNENKEVKVTRADKIKITSDKTILSRVIFNLFKNAIEATRPGGIIELACIGRNNEIEFTVKSENVIPRDIQPLIFNNSFSTKGKGRGIGTYSIKLLTDKYLGGKVSFESNEQIGTVFHAVYPVSLI